MYVAYNVTLFVGVYGEVTLFPPVDAVYHPSNVYPVLVGVGNVTLTGVHFAYIVEFALYNVLVNPLVKYPVALSSCVPPPFVAV